MQVVFVFETKNNKGSDYLYYKSIMYRFYMERGTGIKIQSEFMNGKGNYEKINKNINNLIKQYQGETKVIYFLDVDCDNINSNQEDLNNKIIQFCEKNKYEIIWFNITIEDVFIGNKINKNKTEIANDFFKNDKINEIDENKLKMEDYNHLKNSSSNVLKILDKYLIRK